MKKINILFMAGITMALASCASINLIPNNDVQEGVVIKNRLAYQTTTSLASMVDLSIDNSITSVARKAYGEHNHGDKHQILNENKEKIESILPTLNLLVENDSNFESLLYESDREDYDFKQVISLKDLSDKEVSYTLYYNLAQEDAEEDVENLPENPEDIVVPPSNDEEEIDPNLNQKHKDGKGDNDKFGDRDGHKHGDYFDRDDKERDESITVFGGIAVVDELEYPFIAKSSEEIDDEEIENKFAMKIFTSDHRGSIKVVHEIEEDDDEISESYAYTVKEGRQIKNSFKFENSTSLDDGEESKIKLTLGNERYSFKVYEVEGTTYIRVKFDKMHEDHGRLLYKKVVINNEDGTTDVSFEEVI